VDGWTVRVNQEAFTVQRFWTGGGRRWTDRDYRADTRMMFLCGANDKC